MFFFYVKRNFFPGLCGNSASGKSSVGRRLSSLGAGVVDCDKLGHLAYAPGTDANAKVVEAFGAEVRAEDGSIDRRALGPKVFGNKGILHCMVILRICSQFIYI